MFFMQHSQRRRCAVLQALWRGNGDCAMKPQAFGFRPWALGLVTWALCLVTLGSGIARAQIAMPDPSLIHGKAIPAPELANGTVTVRVVREAIGNNVTGQEVRLTVGGSVRTAKTDEQGRAEFSTLTSGAE